MGSLWRRHLHLAASFDMGDRSQGIQSNSKKTIHNDSPDLGFGVVLDNSLDNSFLSVHQKEAQVVRYLSKDVFQGYRDGVAASNTQRRWYTGGYRLIAIIQLLIASSPFFLSTDALIFNQLFSDTRYIPF
jgi:hypothetical protein